MTLEYHLTPQKSMLEDLHSKFDIVDAHADNEFYTHTALLRRQALQWDNLVLDELAFLWHCMDENGNGAMDKQEYLHLHQKLHHVG